LQVLRGYFPSILALAQSLLRSPDPSMVVPFGGLMYRLSFVTFDSYCQQVGAELRIRRFMSSHHEESFTGAEWVGALEVHWVHWAQSVLDLTDLFFLMMPKTY